MFTMKVVCGCGFQSDMAVWGPPSIFAQTRVGMPVYLPATGKLLTHYFDSRDLGISPEELDAWILEHKRQTVSTRYGEDAVIVAPRTDGETVLFCPNCHRFDARAKVVGMH